MDIDLYKNIIAIAKYGSIGKASEAIFISKSALSRQLISVEDELGIKIFERIGNKLILTYPGRMFLETAIKIVAEEREGHKLIADIVGGHHGRIIVGMPPSRSDIIMPAVLSRFHELYPNVCVECSFRDSADHAKSLESGDIDIAIMSSHCVTQNMNYDVLCQDEYVLILNKNHPYAHMAGTDEYGNRNFFDADWIKNDYFGFEAPGCSARAIAEEFFCGANIKPQILIDNCRYSVLIQLSAAGICNLITQDTYLKYADDLVAFSLNPRRFHTLVAARRKNYIYSKPEHAFIKLLQDYYGEQVSL